MSLNQATKIHWPHGAEPKNSAFHVINAIEMHTPMTVIWNKLIDAEQWPSLYANAQDVVVEGGGVLRQGSRFHWKSFGFCLSSEVVEYEPERRLAWCAQGFGIRAYHAWVIEPSEVGAIVTTEETQNGWMAYLGKAFVPKSIFTWHQRWLEGLSAYGDHNG